MDLELRTWPRVASVPCDTPTSACPGLAYSYELHGQLFLLVVVFCFSIGSCLQHWMA